MSIKKELIQYVNYCLSDKYVSEFEDYISCEKHKWACKRMLEDFNRKNWKYYWNEEEARRIVKWFSYLKHSKGILAGEFIKLTLWQKFILCNIYGWRSKKTTYKRFTKVFIEVARKQSKSQMIAGMILYEMSTQATKNQELYETYCAGTKREQSKLIFNEGQNLLKGSPLRSKFKVTNSKIIHYKTKSFLQPLSKEDGKKGDGTNPAVLALDEYHQHATTEFYDLGLGANSKESLLIIITTAGIDLTYPCYTQEYQYCSSIINPNIDVYNENYFIDICEIDKKDDIYDERNWKKANPLRMSYQQGYEKIKDNFKVAKEVPEKMVIFKTKCLNLWLQSKHNTYMDMFKFKKCEVKKIERDLKGLPVYIGFDMSSKIDLTSIAFVIPFMNKGVANYYIFVHSFIPNHEKLIERERVDKAPYISWVDRGYITVTDTPIVDQEQVISYMEKFIKERKLEAKTLCFDPANASKLMMDLSNRGYECVEVYQSHKSLNESTAGFREQVLCTNIVYEYNPVLNYAMSNAVTKQHNGLIKIDKDATTKRIDPVDSLLAAYKLAQYHEFVFDINDFVNEESLLKLYGGKNEKTD